MKCEICGKDRADTTAHSPKGDWGNTAYGDVNVNTCASCWGLMGSTYCEFDWETVVLATRIGVALGWDCAQMRTTKAGGGSNGRSLFVPFSAAKTGKHHGMLLEQYRKYAPNSMETHLKAEVEVAVKQAEQDRKFRERQILDDLNQPYKPRYPLMLGTGDLRDFFRGRGR